MKTSELIRVELDYWVARAEGYELDPHRGGHRIRNKDREVLAWVGEGRPPFWGLYSPSTNWVQGGLIIDRERMTVGPLMEGGDWYGTWVCTVHGFEDQNGWNQEFGETPLIAAMRAYVASKFGEEVPDEARP